MHELRQDDFRERTFGPEWLVRIVESFSSASVLVIGDAMVDEYHFGRVDRISPEAPVPIFIEEKTEVRRGGADNVAHQLEALGCGVRKVFARRLSIKHRYFAGHHQVFRRDDDQIATPEDVDDAARRIAFNIPDCDVVVLSDYAKGLLTPRLCQDVIGYGKPVVVDPKGRNWFKYDGAHVICPNEHELETVNLTSPGAMVLAKLGAKGLAIRSRDGIEHMRIPALAKQVYDVTGAGDVVTAIAAACCGIRDPNSVSWAEKATIANHAAGVVVGKLGTAVCSKEELLRSLMNG